MSRNLIKDNGSFIQLADQMRWESLSPAAAELVELEKEIPVRIEEDRGLRAKITDKCGMTCTFCHNEGTPVAVALRGITTQRSSVFSGINGVDFMPGQMQPDESFRYALSSMRRSIGSDELHFTGGEPSLHRGIAELTEQAVSLGYQVKMTSNGENPGGIGRAVEAGVSKINFSVFGTTPEELAQVQAEKYRNERLAAHKIIRLKESMKIALDSGVKAGANIVMRDIGDAERAMRILFEYDPRLQMRILHDLDKGLESYKAAYELLATLGAKPEELLIEAGVSNVGVKYRLPDGRVIQFKQFKQTFLPDTCRGCSIKSDGGCYESFYGPRLYVDDSGQYKVGVCIQRMDLTEDLEGFCEGAIPKEIVRLRREEYESLREEFGDRIKDRP
ncbi:radical SAM protein [Candidatus Saccharibacteria bacterium]|nr:radical SAM protein [Candidatus Saccharibacteria bacterium]